MIVGIGELLWDLFPDGRKVAGGAPFNFAFHCQRLGHPAAIVSRVGDDELGRELRAEVRRLGLTDQWIQTDSAHPTGTVRVTVDAAGQPAYEIVEGVAWDYIRWGKRLEALAASGPSVLCHGMLALRSPASRRTVERLATASVRAKPSRSVLWVLDVNLRYPRPSPDQLYSAMTAAEWVKVNADELVEIAGHFVPQPDQLPQYQFQHSGHDRTVWLVTQGAEGVKVIERESGSPYPFATLGITAGGEFLEPGVPARVVDTVGAGDSFTAAMVCLHLEGRPLRECARFATRYAARVCEHQGGTPRIERAEVERAAGL